jgi:hypothetical protein
MHLWYILFPIAFVFTLTFSALGQDTSACIPPCRTGYICLQGRCVEQCNPPCRTGYLCNGKGDCIPVDKTTSTVPGKIHKHTGFYLSINVGLTGGSNTTSGFPSSDTVQKLTLSGAGMLTGFSIGNAVKENIILIIDLSNTLILDPIYKINGDPQKRPTNYETVGLYDVLIGCGGIYYFMPYNFFVSSTLGLAFSDLNINKSVVNTVGQTISETVDLTSDVGFGFRIRAGKEWWKSNRWGLGAAGFFQFSTHGSGAIYTLSGQMYSIMSGLSFTATYN